MRWAIPVVVAAAVTISGISFAAAPSSEAAEAPKYRHHSAHVMAAPSHQAMYMQLLAEKYAPETVPAWKETMTERVALMKALRELKRSGKWKREDAKEKFEKAGKDHRETMKDHMKLIERFTEAVESENAKELKAVLPLLLASEQKLNDALRKVIEEEKNKH